MARSQSNGTAPTLFAALLRAARANASEPDRTILSDADGIAMNHASLVTAALVLGRKLAARDVDGGLTALMLPNVPAFVVAVFGLNAYGRPLAVLNYTAGLRALASAVTTGRIARIVTSRRFIDKANLGEIVSALEATEWTKGRTVEIIEIEDVRASVTRLDKVRGVAAALLARITHRPPAAFRAPFAVLLYTSGTEGLPKGVALSNANLIANVRQIYSHASGHISPRDVVLNPLPMFHSFGLTAGTLMPLLNGLPVILYPSPLHYREIPKLIGKLKPTMLFATDTFLAGYAKAARAGDLASLKLVVAGAERVKETTRALFAESGAVIVEGYGATECAPVIAVNTPSANRPGSVGRALPGIETRLTPVEGLEGAGRLHVRGANVMAGYIRPDAPGVLDPPPGGWHDTGDIVSLDDGFITIRGRAKRFAKLAGEMVSLAAIEGLASQVWPEHNHVAIALPDAKKGEQIVLVTDKPDADQHELMAQAHARGFPDLWVPRTVLVVAAIPVLGTGKTDLPATQEMARQMRPLL